MSAGVRGFLALLLLAAVSDPVWSQVKPQAEPPLLFRREYLPKSLLTREKEKLIPIPRKEFDQWLEISRARAASSLPETWVEAIDLTAALHGNTLIGQARLKVERRRSAASDREIAFVPLAGLKLPVIKSHWERSNRPAVVGMTSEGELLAAIDQSDTLSFDWQLTGRRDPFGGENFDLTVAEASRSTVLLTLPAGTRLEASAGTAERLPSDDADVERWSVQLGGAREVRLRCIPTEATPFGPLLLVREENTCTVAQGELETLSQLRLDVYREPIKQLEVELMGEWTPTAVRLGDSQVPFQLTSDGQNAVLRFEPPLVGLNRRLTFTGRASVELGKRQLAPRVRVKDAAWLDGTLTVEGRGIDLRNWELVGLDRMISQPMGVPGTPRHWLLTSDQAFAAFVVDRLPNDLRAETGSTVRLDVEGATASVVADFATGHSSSFELAAEVAPGWVIDSLETTPMQALEDWQVDAQGTRQLLRIALRQSVSPGQEVRVTLEAHRPAPAASENIGGEQLRPVRWHAESTGYLALGIDPLWQVEFHGGARVERIDPSQLTKPQSERLAIAEDVVLYADDAKFDDARLELAAESPPFNAHWELRIASDGNRFLQEAELRVEPTSAPVERVHVLVRPPAGKSLQWQLQDEENAAVEARLVRAGDDPTGEDEWELSLVRARRNPFNLSARLESREPGAFAVRILRCVEAASQSARATLAETPHGRLTVEEASGLERLWNADDLPAVARWSFDPSQTAALRVRSATSQELRQLLLIERADLETRVTPHQLLHTVDYTITNQQAQSLSLGLPSQCEVEQVVVAGERVDPRVSSSDHQIAIPLPKKSGAFQVQVSLRAPNASTAGLLLVEPAWPDLSMPAAAQSWHLIFPDEYRPLTWSSAASWTWSGLARRIQVPLPGFESRRRSAATDNLVACSELSYASTSGLPRRVRFLNGDALAGLSWLLLAACWAVIGGRSWMPRQRFSLVAIMGVAALSLPACFDPVGRMILLGCAAGLLTRHLYAVPAADARSPSPRSISPAAAGLLLIAVMTSAAFTAQAHAQDPRPVEIVHRVIFPVDNAGKPADDYVYTSEPFYKELYRRSHQPAASRPSTLWVSGEYRARPRSDALAWDSIEATLEMEVLQPGPVQLPWGREMFVLPPERIRLDGRTTPVSWNMAGTSFTVNVEGEGRHTLQFVAQPTRRDDAQCTLTLPPTATARMLIDTLDDAASVQAWPGPLPVAFTGEDGVQVLELGSRREVTMVTRPIDAADGALQAEQLLWANVWRGGGMIEGRWRFRAEQGLLAEAVVDVGKNLELISAASLSPAAVRWQPGEDNSQMVWTPRAATDELVVEAVFLWQDATDERILPRIEPHAAEVTRRWLAIDPRGNDELVLTRGGQEVDVGEFAALWNAETWPAAAQSLTRPGPVLLGTFAHGEPLTYDATTNCDISSAGTSFRFQAQVKDTGHPLSLIRINIPPGAVIQSADVGVAGQFRSVPWLSLAGNEIALLPSEPIRSGNVVQLHAELPSAGQQTFAVPQVGAAQELAHTVYLSRRSDVRVTLASYEGFRLVDESSQSASADAVAHLELDRSSSSPRQLKLTTEPNRPRTVGILVTTLRREGAQWIARLDAFLAVRDGVVDSFDLESNGVWNTPRLVAGSAALQTRDLAGNSRQLVLRPRGTPGNRYHFAIEGTLPAQRVQAPLFRLLGAENVQQYLRLPESGNYSWSTSGLQEAPLPSAAVSALGEEDLLVYRIAVPQSQAELLANDTAVTTPRVAWGSVHVWMRRDGSFVANAEMLVDPAGIDVLPVALPEQALLVQASVEGEAALTEPKGQRRFMIPLRSSRLPQLVRILYAGERVPDSDLSVLVPRFEQWKIDQPLRVTVGDEEATGPTPETLAALLSNILAEPPQPQEELSSWAAQWRSRLQAHSAEVSANQEQVQALLERLETMVDGDLIAPKTTRQTPVAGDSVSSHSPGQAYVGPWLAALALWFGLVAGGYRASRMAQFQEFARRWPSATAALVALSVAILLSPWIGGALLAVAAASSLAWPWHRPAR